MEKFKNMGQKTLGGIMGIIMLFLVADIIVFLLMYFNVDLGGIIKTTENTVFNNLNIVKNTDNSIILITDNSQL